MMIGSSSKQTLHLSISNSYQIINDNDKTPKCKKENITKKNTSAQNNVNNPLKKDDPLKHLMEQKQKITDSRQKYLDGALSKSESSQTIKQKLAEYDKQISEIDKQISELNLAEQQKHMGTADKDRTNDKVKDNSNNTEKYGNTKIDENDQMMNNLVSVSNNISAVKTLSAAKTSGSGEKRVLECEIKLDEGRGLNPISKKKRVAKLKDNIEKIDKNIGDKLNNHISADNPNNVVNRNEHSEEEKSAKIASESTNDSKVLQAIKNYKENNDNKTQASGPKLNYIA